MTLFLTRGPLPVVRPLGLLRGRPEGLVGAVDRDAGGDEVLEPVASLAALQLKEALGRNSTHLKYFIRVCSGLLKSSFVI